MNIEALCVEMTSQRQCAVLSNDGGMVSHNHSSSTNRAIVKHILSLDDRGCGSHSVLMKIGERIVSARKSRGISQNGLGSLINVGQTTISSWERSRTIPTRDDVRRIAAALRVSVGDIEGSAKEREAQSRFKDVPVLSWVSAGRIEDSGDLAAHSGERVMFADLPSGDYFATTVRGDSMDRQSPEGSRIIVNAADRDPRPGSCYLFCLRGETTYKRYQADPVVRLEPYSTNPANQTIFPKAEKDWSVIGRVVRSYLDIE